MRLVKSVALFGTAATLLAAPLALAQSAKVDVRIQRDDQKVDVFQQDVKTEWKVQDDFSPKLKTAQRVPVTVSKRLIATAGDGVLGVQVSPVPPAMAAQLRLHGGAVVESVLPGSAAERAGLAQYDVIERVDGKDVASPQQLQKTVTGHEKGDQVALSVIREGKRRTIQVTVPERAEPQRTIVKPYTFDGNIKAPDFKNFQFTPEDKQKLGQMSENLKRDLQQQEEQIQQMAEKLRAQMDQVREQIRQLRDQVREEAKQQKEKAMEKLKEEKEKLKEEKDKLEQQQ